LRSGLFRTQFWDTPLDEHAALTLGERGTPRRLLGDAPRHLDVVEEHFSLEA
jgi:hypothetical protein